MKVNTKYNTGDKVWFYIEEYNRYAWGKVLSIDISVRRSCVDVIQYNIENRFYNEKYYMYSGFRYDEIRKFETISILSLMEKEVFDSPDKIKEYLNKEHINKMINLKELKKGLFRNDN